MPTVCLWLGIVGGAGGGEWDRPRWPRATELFGGATFNTFADDAVGISFLGASFAVEISFPGASFAVEISFLGASFAVEGGTAASFAAARFGISSEL